MKKKCNVSVSIDDFKKTGNRKRKRPDPKNTNQGEALIRRFLKKCKKERVVKEYIEKTSYYKSKSQKRREKRNRAVRRQRREANSKSK